MSWVMEGPQMGCCNKQDPSLPPGLGLTGHLGVFTVSQARLCSSARRRPINLLTSLAVAGEWPWMCAGQSPPPAGPICEGESSSHSVVADSAIPGTVAHQAPLSTELSRQEC